MQPIGTISAEQFMLHFYEDIRVQIDWKKLVSENAIITCLQLCNRNELGDLYTVWGKKSDGSYEQNHNLKVKGDFPENCQTALNNFSREFLNLDVILIGAPTYKCKCDKYVLLDRTHRVISLYRHNTVNFRVIIYSVDYSFLVGKYHCHNCGHTTE